MKTNDKHINHPSSQQLHAYCIGKLTHEQSHQIERHLLNCAYCSETLSGMEAMKGQGVDFQKINQELLTTLNQRIAPKSARRLIPLWSYSMAASVLLAVGLGWYFWQKTQPLSENIIAKQQQSPKADSIVFEQAPEVAIAPAKPSSTTVPFSGETKQKTIPNTNKQKELENERVDDAVPLENTVTADDVKAKTSKADEEAPQVVRSEVQPAPARMKQASAAPAATTALPQEFSGRVLDKQTRQPLAGATISANDRVIAQTDTLGRFEIQKPKTEERLAISHRGFEDYPINVDDVKPGDFYMQPIRPMDSEVQFIDLKNKTTWKYSPNNHPAMPTNGWEAFYNYMNGGKKADKTAIESVIMEFKVGKDGAITEVKVIKNQSQDSNEILIQRLNASIWLPKTLNGNAKKQKVQVKF